MYLRFEPEVHTSEQSWLVREADPDVRHESAEDRAKLDRRQNPGTW